MDILLHARRVLFLASIRAAQAVRDNPDRERLKQAARAGVDLVLNSVPRPLAGTFPSKVS